MLSATSALSTLGSTTLSSLWEAKRATAIKVAPDAGIKAPEKSPPLWSGTMPTPPTKDTDTGVPGETKKLTATAFTRMAPTVGPLIRMMMLQGQTEKSGNDKTGIENTGGWDAQNPGVLDPDTTVTPIRRPHPKHMTTSASPASDANGTPARGLLSGNVLAALINLTQTPGGAEKS